LKANWLEFGHWEELALVIQKAELVLVGSVGPEKTAETEMHPAPNREFRKRSIRGKGPKDTRGA
jgi:hypothetical protein